MKYCQSCGGIIGKDCFNPGECAQITQSMQNNSNDELQRRLHEMDERFWMLISVLESNGMDLHMFKQGPEPDPLPDMKDDDPYDLPF
jgi:hypothetical protein